MSVVTITLKDEKDGGVSIRVLSDPPLPINLGDYTEAQYFASEMASVLITSLNLRENIHAPQTVN